MRAVVISTSNGCRLFCLLLGVLLWVAAAPTVFAQESAHSTTATPKAKSADQSQSTEPLNVAPGDAVITIDGLCENPVADKAALSGCKTVITRSEFEKLADAIQPNMKGRARREFALNYATALVMAKKAEQLGLDKGARFDEQMKLARIQVLSQDLKRAIQSEASQIADADIERYYHDNISSFDVAEMERIYVPKTQDIAASSDETSSGSARVSQQQEAQEFMKEAANKLRTRAANGEDFNTLQAEAYKIAGIKATANPRLGKIRRISLPPNDERVFYLQG